MASPSSSKYLSPTSLSRSDELLMNWPFSLESYSPVLTFGKDIATRLSEFEKAQLSKDTAVQCIKYTTDHSVHESVLTEDLSKKIHTSSDQYIHELFFINRFIMKADTQNLPKDIKRLRISKLALRRLLSHYEVPPAFVSSMISKSLASLPFQHRHLSVRKRKVFDFFYILPVRVGIACTESARSHMLSSAGSNQMDPSQYLHLSDMSKDIRPSKIAVFSQHDEESHQTRTICVDFQDGRWSDLAQEPFLRTREVLGQASGAKRIESPFFFHLLLLTSVSEWWRQTLTLFNKQLIVYEKQLQEQTYRPDSVPGEFVDDTNKALHTMVAHLHRYKTETTLLEEITLCLSTYCQCSCTNQTPNEPPNSIPDLAKGSSQNDNSSSQSSLGSDSCFKSIATEFKSLRIFVSELDSKAQTTLGLLFNNIRVANDKLLVANGDSMRQILAAASDEARLSRKMAKQSQKMAVDMRRDSTSMKTIAIMTMFFLPATSFAAVLSMPFFSQARWMGNIDRVWLWVALSIPSTVIAFAIFYMYTRRGDREIEKDDIEMNSIEEPA